MKLRKILFLIIKLNQKIFVVLFWIFAIAITVIGIFSGLPLIQAAEFLGFTYLVLALIYGIYRFLRYIFED